MIFFESDLKFEFNEKYLVKKFDDHNYYKILSGAGLKGVDFIAVDEEENIFLVEVKNYCKRTGSPVEPNVDDLFGQTPRLQKHFETKLTDSLKLIEVINLYLRRKWWIRLQNYFNLSKTFWKSKDWAFWLNLKEIIDREPSKVHGILYLRLQDSYTNIDSKDLKIQVELLSEKMHDLKVNLIENIELKLTSNRSNVVQVC